MLVKEQKQKQLTLQQRFGSIAYTMGNPGGQSQEFKPIAKAIRKATKGQKMNPKDYLAIVGALNYPVRTKLLGELLRFPNVVDEQLALQSKSTTMFTFHVENTLATSSFQVSYMFSVMIAINKKARNTLVDFLIIDLKNVNNFDVDKPYTSKNRLLITNVGLLHGTELRVSNIAFKNTTDSPTCLKFVGDSLAFMGYRNFRTLSLANVFPVFIDWTNPETLENYTQFKDDVAEGISKLELSSIVQTVSDHNIEGVFKCLLTKKLQSLRLDFVRAPPSPASNIDLAWIGNIIDNARMLRRAELQFESLEEVHTNIVLSLCTHARLERLTVVESNAWSSQSATTLIGRIFALLQEKNTKTKFVDLCLGRASFDSVESSATVQKNIEGIKDKLQFSVNYSC